MKTCGIRIREVRKVRGFSNPKLAKLVGVSTSTITFWEQDLHQPSGKNLTKLCDVLDTTPEYLLYGVNPEEVGSTYSNSQVNESGAKYISSNTQPAIHKNYGYVPIISWIQAGETHVAFVDESEEYETIACYKKHSSNTYALRVMGESMTTDIGPFSFPEGTIIIVDPEQKGDETNGIFVVAKENGNDAVTFKQLKYDGATPYLNPLNKDYKKIFSDFRVLGKVIDVKIELP